VSAGDALLALGAMDHSSELLLAAGLLMARAAVDALGDSSASHAVAAALLALETLAARTQESGTAGGSWWVGLGGVAPDLQRQAALAALRTALLTTLTDAERKADAMVESGSVVAALRELILSADRVTGALSLVGKSVAVQMAASLKKSLCAVEQQAASTPFERLNADMHLISLQWVQLHAWVDAWTAEDHADHEYIETRTLHRAHGSAKVLVGAEVDRVSELASSEPSAVSLKVLPDYRVGHAANHPADGQRPDDRPTHRLEQIFIQEATQRLARLHQVVSAWANHPAESLPLAVANEAHGLAGSSATVGRQRLHDGALALEQVVDHLVICPCKPSMRTQTR